MKDGLEVAEGVRTASSATNGGGINCEMRSLDEQSRGADLAALDINALLVGGTLLSTDDRAKKHFACSICKRSFRYKHVLQNHERTHTGEKPFECSECHKRFTRDHHLKTHMRLHTGEKPYQCPNCDRHFVQVANLRRHLRVHTGERPYACEMCESRFSDSNQLKAHMLIHNGEKPYQCEDCHGKFRRRHHLIHHKCPKDESNMGKARRGRRPKAYDQIPTSDHEGDHDEELLHLTDNEEHFNGDTHTSSSEPDQPSPESVRSVIRKNSNHRDSHHNGSDATTNGHDVSHNGHDGTHNGHDTPVNGHDIHNGHEAARNGHGHTPVNGHDSPMNGHDSPVNGLDSPPNGHIGMCNGHSNGHRRKPSRTIRILTPQQRELFLRDKVSMQTQAIDMSLSPSAVDVQPVTVIVPNRFLSSVDGVLDLSSSRSDSEVDVIEEDVHRDEDCDCRLSNYHRTLSQRIADRRSNILGLVSGMEAMNGRHSHHSDDSNESHLHLNGVNHLSTDDDTMAAIALTAKKASVATA